MTNLQTAKIEELKGAFEGEILGPSDGAYDSARQIWNAMIDKRPAVIARCATTSDVVRGVNFARDNRLLLAVRGGGHNIAGNALCDDGLVIDLSQMKTTIVDPGARRVTIEGGATLGDLDAATQAHGLATPVGINSTTGIAGLTLGGGFGWLSRKYGLTVDNLESAEVVTAVSRRATRRSAFVRITSGNTARVAGSLRVRTPLRSGSVGELVRRGAHSIGLNMVWFPRDLGGTSSAFGWHSPSPARSGPSSGSD
jgi:FAD/FMN-containing dehydrogenase